jgi:hypothetical protein
VRYPPKSHTLRTGEKPTSRAAPLRTIGRPLPPSERDDFVLRVSRLANGHSVPLIDAVHALMTIADMISNTLQKTPASPPAT